MRHSARDEMIWGGGAFFLLFSPGVCPFVPFGLFVVSFCPFVSVFVASRFIFQ